MAALLAFENVTVHTHKKRGASLMLVPRCKGLRIARIVETSNAESPTPMNIYITLQGTEVCTNSQCGLYINIPRGVPVALFLTNSLNLRDSGTSKPKRSVTPFYMYVSCPHPTQGAFSKSNDVANLIKIIQNVPPKDTKNIPTYYHQTLYYTYRARLLYFLPTVYYSFFAWYTIEQLDPPILLDR